MPSVKGKKRKYVSSNKKASYKKKAKVIVAKRTNSANFDLIKQPYVPTGGFPLKKMVVLKTTIHTAHSYSAATSATTQLKANSIFTNTAGSTPTYTMVKHWIGQDSTTGAATAPYARYRIHKSAIRVNATISQAATEATGVEVIVVPVVTGSITSAELSEWPYAKKSNLLPGRGVSTSAVKLYNEMDTYKIWDRTNIKDDPGFAAAYASDPANLWYWDIQSLITSAATDATLEVDIAIELFILVEFSILCVNTAIPA